MLKADTRILVIFLKTQDHSSSSSSSTNTNPGQFGFRRLLKHDESGSTPRKAPHVVRKQLQYVWHEHFFSFSFFKWLVIVQVH